MIRRIATTAGAMLVLGALSVTLSLIGPLRRPPSEPVELVRATELTCAAPGRVLGLGDAKLSVRALGATDAVTSDAQIDSPIEGPGTLSAEAVVVGGVFTEAPVRTWTPCTTPGPAGMLLVAKPQDTEIVIVNSDANEAVVDLSLYGVDGEISAVGARGIAVAPGVSRVVALSVLAPQGPVGVAYTASAGRATVIARPVEGRSGPSSITSTTQATQVIGGIPADATSVSLLLSNPTENRVSVAVRALGSSASYEPAPAADISLAPMTSRLIDLGTSLGGEASALRISADAPVAAAVVVETGPGLASHLVSGNPAEALGALVPTAQSVQVTNPGTGAATVALTAGEETTRIDVAAESSVTMPVSLNAAAPVRVTSTGAVLASVNSGGVIIPLEATAEDGSTTGVVVLDPALR